MYKNTSDELLSVSGADISKCIHCGRCSAACPAGDEMELRPHQFVSRLKAGDINALISADSIWACLTCFSCAERCPRDVKPGRLLEAARLLHLRRQGEERISLGEVPALVEPDMPQQLLVSAFRKYRR